MAQVPDPIHTVAAKVYDFWHSCNASKPARPYLGASALGGPCERALWYGFRFADTRQFDGRIYRLFNRGQREEEIVFEELKGIGCEVHPFDSNGRQWAVSAIGGHLRGHLDAAVSNTPYGKSWSVLEIKTHSEKSFKELKDKGVQQAKPEHFYQMQIYMGLTGMERAMYYAINKNTDEIHTEWIHFDKAEFGKMMDRAKRIITADEPPLRLRDDPTYFICKWCDFAPICHGTEAPQPTCRTCAHATPRIDTEAGDWVCEKNGSNTIPLGHQRESHECHRFIPALLGNFAEYEGTPDGENPQYRNKLTGKHFGNGSAPNFASTEIRACQDKRCLGDDGVAEIRGVLDGKVVA